MYLKRPTKIGRAHNMTTNEGFRERLLFLIHWIGFLTTSWIIYWILQEATEWPNLLGIFTTFIPLVLGWLVRSLNEGYVSPLPWIKKKMRDQQ